MHQTQIPIKYEKTNTARTQTRIKRHTYAYIHTPICTYRVQLRPNETIKENHWRKARKERDRGSVMKKMTHKRRYFMFTKLYG